MTIVGAVLWILFIIEAFLTLFATAVCVVAFADCVRRPANMFEIMSKRSKGFWTAVTGIAALVCLVQLWQTAVPLFAGGHMVLGSVNFISALAVVAGGVYLADVKPALT